MTILGIIAAQNYPRTFTVDFLVAGGGGGGGSFNSGVRWGTGGNGGNATASNLAASVGVGYAVTVGAGGAGATGSAGTAGSTGGNSKFNTTTSNGGAGNPTNNIGGFGNGTTNASGAGGWGGIGLSSSITGSSVKYVGGGTYGNADSGNKPADYGVLYGGGETIETGPVAAPIANRGGGGGGGQNQNDGGARTFNGQTGGSGVVILKIPDNRSASFSGGVTSSTVTSGGFKTITITAAGLSDTVTFS